MQNMTPNHPLSQRASVRGALWLIGISLSVVATCMVLESSRGSTPAFAQPVARAGARGIFSFTGRLTDNTFGLFMVDVDAMTVWCYEYLSGNKELRLVAARSWMYDRYLENYNCSSPSPEEVERIVQHAREAKLRNRSQP